MQTKYSALIGATLLWSAMAFTSCSTDDLPAPDTRELYNREFIKEFGVVASDHDWNMATRASVTVTTASPTEVKVYADVKGERYLFAHYSAVNGSETINFDLPKDVNGLIVKAGGKTYKTQVGGTVNIDGRSGRLITEPGASEDNILEWRSSRERMLLTSAFNQYIENHGSSRNPGAFIKKRVVEVLKIRRRV